MKSKKNIFIILSLLIAAKLFANDTVLVKITKDIPYIYVNHMGQKIKVARIQDTANILTDDYSKTSRPCPPFCIQPTTVFPGVKNIEEVELINFMKNKVASKKGIVVDARLKQWYELETIPSAINLPYIVMQTSDEDIVRRLFLLLGMKIDKNGNYDFSDAKELAIFCNGLWSDESSKLIKSMLKSGYPADKIYYYRSGFQGWKLLGLTTVVQKENKK